MLYEKKMLILSGAGKGVVLIEKSAQGVKFSLRTFDMPPCGELKAGIITRTSVFVRDLPSGDNPATVFTVNAGNIDELHFAVFDKELRLYGTNGKRMWEANLMDLLNKNDRRAPVLAGTPTAALPPIAPRPQVLPMPDGMGIPQSRLAIYGDEAIAESDFYTALDIESRMPEVDGFLDSPRVLDGLAPRIVPPPDIAARDLVQAETTAALDARARQNARSQTDGAASASVEVDFAAAEPTADVRTDRAVDNIAVNAADDKTNIEEAKSNIADATDIETPAPEQNAEPVETTEIAEIADDAQTTEARFAQADAGPFDKTEVGRADATSAASDTVQDIRPVQNVQSVTPERSARVEQTAQTSAQTEQPVRPAQAEAAATTAAQVDEYADCDDMPWALTARWLKNRTKRMPLVRKERVRKTPVNDNVRFLRKSDFFERTRSDIDKLFSNAERDKELAELLSDIEWVKVQFDGHRISVGRSGNAFLCYAVGGTYEKISPLGDEAQWLPAKRDMPTGNGYWLIFQNLADGQIIKN